MEGERALIPLVVLAPPPPNVQPHLAPRQPSQAELEVGHTPHCCLILGWDSNICTAETPLGREDLRGAADFLYRVAAQTQVCSWRLFQHSLVVIGLD
jgi:hypothetical protein